MGGPKDPHALWEAFWICVTPYGPTTATRSIRSEKLDLRLTEDANRTIQAADIAGIRAFVVHAKDEPSKCIYYHFNFIPSPTDSMHLYLLLKDFKHLSSAIKA